MNLGIPCRQCDICKVSGPEQWAGTVPVSEKLTEICLALEAHCREGLIAADEELWTNYYTSLIKGCAG